MPVSMTPTIDIRRRVVLAAEPWPHSGRTDEAGGVAERLLERVVLNSRNSRDVQESGDGVCGDLRGDAAVRGHELLADRRAR